MGLRNQNRQPLNQLESAVQLSTNSLDHNLSKSRFFLDNQLSLLARTPVHQLLHRSFFSILVYSLIDSLSASIDAFRSGCPKTALPATNTSTPASTQALAVTGLIPPSTSNSIFKSISSRHSGLFLLSQELLE